MEIEMRRARRTKRGKNILLCSGLIGLVIISLFINKPFLTKTRELENRSRVVWQQLKAQITSESLMPSGELRLVSVAEPSGMTEKNSTTSDIYPILEKARTALKEVAQLDGNKV